MANKKHHHMFMQGAKVWNEWRKKYPELRPNLRGIDIGIYTSQYLHYKDMGEDSLIQRQFNNFKLNAVKLSTEELVGVNLSNADLRDTNFWMVNLSYADMRGANLTRAYLRDTNFYRTNLKEANLSQSLLRSTLFTSTYLDNADFT